MYCSSGINATASGPLPCEGLETLVGFSVPLGGSARPKPSQGAETLRGLEIQIPMASTLTGHDVVPP